MQSSLRSPFQIQHRLGRGATSEVFAAVARDGREVALKIGHSNPSVVADVRRCFEREVYAACLVKSAHVPAAHDWQLSPGAPYIAFDRIHGKTLAETLRSGPLPLGAVVDLGRQLLCALKDVHAAGLVHSDVKPANILLAPEPTRGMAVMLVDFGIMRDVDDNESPDARFTFGTPSYMSPEQVLGGRLDARTDVYSASVVLYMALTAKRPFAWSPDSKKVLRRVLEAPVTPPRAARPDCPLELERLVLRGLARRPADRFKSASAMRAVLDRFARRSGLPRDAAAWSECDLTSERGVPRAA